MKETRSFASNERFSSKTPSEAYTEDGGLTWRWASNDTYIRLDVCKSHDISCDQELQESARSKQEDKFLADYRERMKNHVPSAEEMFEMRSAFGPGASIKNAITGQTIRL